MKFLLKLFIQRLLILALIAVASICIFDNLYDGSVNPRQELKHAVLTDFTCIRP